MSLLLEYWQCKHFLNIQSTLLPSQDDITRLLTINSLYGGGKIAQEADNVILIQDESTLPDVTYPKRFVQVVKNRYDGQLGRMDLAFNRSVKSFSTKVTVHEASRPKFPQTLVNEPGWCFHMCCGKLCSAVSQTNALREWSINWINCFRTVRTPWLQEIFCGCRNRV